LRKSRVERASWSSRVSRRCQLCADIVEKLVVAAAARS